MDAKKTDRQQVVRSLLASGSILLPRGEDVQIDLLCSSADEQGYTLLLNQDGDLIAVTPKGEVQPVVLQTLAGRGVINESASVDAASPRVRDWLVVIEDNNPFLHRDRSIVEVIRKLFTALGLSDDTVVDSVKLAIQDTDEGFVVKIDGREVGTVKFGARGSSYFVEAYLGASLLERRSG